MHIIDRIKGNGQHDVSVHFHFEEGIDFRIIDKGIVTENKGGKNIHMTFSGNKSLHFELIKAKSWVSKSYGTKSECVTLEVKFTMVRLPLLVETEISLLNE